MTRLLSLTCLALLLTLTSKANAVERLALVIGNAAYSNVPALANPGNDARLMADTLRETGFGVTMVLDADRSDMTQAVENFGQALRAAGPGAIGLFYFAGHGVRSDGFNYLLPLNLQIRAESDIAREAIAAEWVQETIQVPGVTSVMVLDACRNNPFDGHTDGSVADLGDGLARMTARENSLIAYATGPGEVALDGLGDNSPYTSALVRAIRTPGLAIDEVFARVREDVETATSGAQIPWERLSLAPGLLLGPGSGPAEAATDQSPAETLSLRLSVGFRPGRWNSDALVCRRVYGFEPVRLAVADGQPLRVTAVTGGDDIALELSARREGEGVDLSIVPISAGVSSRPVVARIADRAAGRRQTVHTGVRHPDHFTCGPMTVFVSPES